MEYRLLLKREAAKYLAGLDKPTRTKIKKALEGLIKNPPEGDIAPMQGREGLFRLRVGSYRLVFQVKEEEQIIIVAAIGPRGDIYKK
jgi:mRNA interferase RelE/StbE